MSRFPEMHDRVEVLQPFFSDRPAIPGQWISTVVTTVGKENRPGKPNTFCFRCSNWVPMLFVADEGKTWRWPVTNPCDRCDGCGFIANTDEGEPWTTWLELPASSAIAVDYGIVRALRCPACKGTGEAGGQ